MSIPKIIHQFWISNSGNELPDDVIKNIQSWEETHPDFIRVVWTLPQLSMLLENFHGLKVLQCIQACRFPAMQSDLIRLAMIYEHGGFWSDLKNYALRPFLYDLLGYDSPVLAEHWPVKNPPEIESHLVNSFFAAPKQDEYIWACLEKACGNVNKRKKRGVFGLTGAGVMMRVLDHMKCSGNPCDYHLIEHSELWNINLKRLGGSYNDGNQHWSIRQKTELPYL